MYLDIEPRAVPCRAVLVTREGGTLRETRERLRKLDSKTHRDKEARSYDKQVYYMYILISSY